MMWRRWYQRADQPNRYYYESNCWFPLYFKGTWYWFQRVVIVREKQTYWDNWDRRDKTFYPIVLVEALP